MTTSKAGGASRDRARAARILVDILYRHKTTDQSFGLETESGSRALGSALLQELVYGCLRYYFILEPLVAPHLQRAFRSKDLDLRCLLLVGAYQLYFMRIPDHAAINETVNACRGLRKPWASGMVNAVLRAIRDARGEGSDPYLSTAKLTRTENTTERSVYERKADWFRTRNWGLPDWIAERLTARLGAEAEAAMAASLERAPMSVRVNGSRISPSAYAAKLTEQAIDAHPGWRGENLILTTPVPARTLPGYLDGLISVQDAGALFAAPLVTEAAPTGRILDACAAPGGKLFHMAELAPEATIVGLELSPRRLAHLSTEARRLGHDRVILREGDATRRDWHDGAPFDAMLLDAPCSGSGTLRRHPDIKILRQPDDLPGYAALQRQLLDNLWPLLKPGGTFVYCTCSMFTEENDAVIERFLAGTPDASLHALHLPTGVSTEFGWQLVPQISRETPDKSVDGFYFARMTRREKAR